MVGLCTVSGVDEVFRRYTCAVCGFEESPCMLCIHTYVGLCCFVIDVEGELREFVLYYVIYRCRMQQTR